MPQLNLATEVYRAQLIGRKRRLLYTLSIVIIALVLGAWGTAFFLLSSVQAQISRVENDTNRMDTQLNARQDVVRSITLFMRRLDLARRRLDQHLGWSPILTAFEQFTLPSASFTKLSGAPESGIGVSATVPSLDAAADLIASLKASAGTNDTPFTSVQLVSVGENSALAPGAGGGPSASGYLVQLRLTASPRTFSLSASPVPVAASVASPVAAPPVTTPVR